jgi:hypothetical protein
MPRHFVAPAGLLAVATRQVGLVTSAQCDEHGVADGPRTRLVRTGRWLRPTRGVYDVAPMPDDRRHPDDRRARAAWLGMLAFGPRAIAVGQSALALHGIAGLPMRIEPQVALPGGESLRSRDGLRVRHFDGFATVSYGGRRIASLDAALVQALPELPRNSAVALCDSALNRRLIDDVRLDAVRERMRGRRGAARVEDWWHLVDGRAESPLETDARLRCVDAGIPPDDLQVVVRDASGRTLARGDLGWRLSNGRWLLAEIDGRDVHSAPEALYNDRVRQNRLVATGRVDLFRFVGSDIRARPGLVAPIREHLATHAQGARRSA